MKAIKKVSTPATLLKPILVGAGVALIVILFFVTGAETDPDWGRFWRVRPLIVVPVAGGLGGALYHLVGRLGQKGGWMKVVAIFIGLIVYLFVLWIGIVLGLDGTLWD